MSSSVLVIVQHGRAWGGAGRDSCYEETESITQPRGNKRVPSSDTECVFGTLYFVASYLNKVFSDRFDWFVV